MTNDNIIISAKGIYKYFGSLKVLNGISYDIKKGEKIVVIGPSGSGKSTFLRCLNLLELPTYGEVWFGDKLVTDVDPYLHRDVIEVSQTYQKMFAERKKENIDKSDEEIKNSISLL